MCSSDLAYLSQTKNDDPKALDDIEALFKELSIGLAYRPVKYDKYALLGKITYLEDQTPLNRNTNMAATKTGVMVFSTEGTADLTKNFQGIGKVAYKNALESLVGQKSTKSATYLYATGVKYKIDAEDKWLDDWRIGVEYRLLVSQLAEDRKGGAVLELDRAIHKYVYFGVGYNFTDFTDDLTEYNDDYKISGFFIRVTGKY